MTMFLDLVRNLLGLLDSLIYGFVDTVYVTFTTIASYTLVNSEIINNFATRIYSLIGIFMLFKMLFSLITYFIDPDKLVDQKAGFGNLVQRTIVSLVLLILVPYIFQLAFHAQTIILQQNILANIVLGGEYSSISTEERLDSYNHAGQKMSFAVLSAFFHPKDVNVLTMSEEDLKKNYDGDELQALQEYRSAAKDFDVGKLLEWGGIKNKENDDGYIFSYTMVISTLGGALVLWMMFLFCIDIGVRAVKLSFLQLIAPIPVLSYIDAQKGQKIFDGWVKECVSTYLEVFVKLLIIYFVVFLITILTKDGFTIYEYQLSGGDLVTKKVTDGDLFAQALIILGLLMFAGQAPKLIGDLFGVKIGDFSLNPMKKIGASPLASGIIGGAVGAGLGVFANGTNLAKNIKANGLKKTFLGDGTHVNKNGVVDPDKWYHSLAKVGRTAGSVVGASAGTRAMMKGFKGGGKGSIWSNAMSGLKESNDARYKRSQYIAAGYTPTQRASDKIDSIVGYKNKYAGVGKMDEDLQKLKNRAAEFDTRETRARESMIDLETRYANQYGAETFDVGFQRDADGNLLYQQAEGDTDYEKYIKYMNKLNKDRFNAGEDKITTIVDEKLFDQYSNLEKNVNYYNSEHENIKKEIKAKEKIIKTRKEQN